MDYKILYEKDISYANVKRYVYYVEIPSETSDKDLKIISKDLINKLKKLFKKPYENVTVFYFNTSIDYNHGNCYAIAEKKSRKAPIILERR